MAGGAVGVQEAPNSSTKAKSFQIAFLSHPPSMGFAAWEPGQHNALAIFNIAGGRGHNSPCGCGPTWVPAVSPRAHGSGRAFTALSDQCCEKQWAF